MNDVQSDLKLNALVMHATTVLAVNGSPVPKQVIELTGALMAYYEAMPADSAERAELMNQVTALQDAHSDLQTALHRINRACLYVKDAIMPTLENDD